MLWKRGKSRDVTDCWKSPNSRRDGTSNPPTTDQNLRGYQEPVTPKTAQINSLLSGGVHRSCKGSPKQRLDTFQPHQPCPPPIRRALGASAHRGVLTSPNGGGGGHPPTALVGRHTHRAKEPPNRTREAKTPLFGGTGAQLVGWCGDPRTDRNTRVSMDSWTVGRSTLLFRLLLLFF